MLTVPRSWPQTFVLLIYFRTVSWSFGETGIQTFTWLIWLRRQRSSHKNISRLVETRNSRHKTVGHVRSSWYLPWVATSHREGNYSSSTNLLKESFSIFFSRISSTFNICNVRYLITIRIRKTFNICRASMVRITPSCSKRHAVANPTPASRHDYTLT